MMVLIDHLMSYLIKGEGNPIEITSVAAALGFMRLKDILLIFFVTTVVIPKKKITALWTDTVKLLVLLVVSLGFDAAL